jgi:hypothetical protein
MINRRCAFHIFLLVTIFVAAVISFAQSFGSQAGTTKNSDALVVPAGTEIKVAFVQPVGSPNFVEGKVAVPVRVGWATPIPATSKVKMRVSGEYVDLASITVGKVSYNVKTNAMPLFTSASGTDCEMSFVLKEPLEIER